MVSGSQLSTKLITTRGANELVNISHVLVLVLVPLNLVFDLFSISMIFCSVPFVPAMSPMEQEHNPFQGVDCRHSTMCTFSSYHILGISDYSDVSELIPDKPMMKSQQANRE